MDYKTTTLIKELKTTEILLPEIQGLYFGFMGEDKAVFDYTTYFEENHIQYIDYKVFMRTNKHHKKRHQNCSTRIQMDIFW